MTGLVGVTLLAAVSLVLLIDTIRRGRQVERHARDTHRALGRAISYRMIARRRERRALEAHADALAVLDRARRERRAVERAMVQAEAARGQVERALRLADLAAGRQIVAEAARVVETGK